MSIIKPFDFVAGTRARSNEVNEDFDVLYSQVNVNLSEIGELDLKVQDLESTKAEINGSSSQRFSVADPVNSGDAVNKRYLEASQGNTRKYIYGLSIIKDSNSPKDTIIVTAGMCYDTKNRVLMQLPEDTSKKNSTQAINTIYYVHLISNDIGRTYDILISPSQMDPPLPSGFTVYRCIGYYNTDSEGKIVTITQFSDTNKININNVLPDYKRAVNLVFENGMVMEKNGWLTMALQTYAGRTSSFVYINGVLVNQLHADIGEGGFHRDANTVMVSAGDVLTAKSAKFSELIFMPFKEER